MAYFNDIHRTKTLPVCTTTSFLFNKHPFPRHATAIFSNVEGILSVNLELFSCMRQKSLGEAFNYLAPFLKLYSTYANNFQTATETLQVSLTSATLGQVYVYTCRPINSHEFAVVSDSVYYHRVSVLRGQLQIWNAASPEV